MFCPNCGKELMPEALFCGNCGTKVESYTAPAAPAPQAAPQAPVVQPVQTPPAGEQFHQVVKDDNSTLVTLIKVFMIIGTVAQGWLIVPLAWCIPMTISVFRSLKEGRPISMAMKICTLLFVNLISGVCMLCMKDDAK